MAYRYSLAFLTVAELSPPEAVRVAARAGYDHVGLRLLPSGTEGPYPILTDAKLRRETQATIAETGVTVADIEIIRIASDFNVKSTIPFLDCGAKLGAKNILVAGYDPNANRMTQSFGAFCELVQTYGMTADLEFMPWTEIPNAKSAIAQLRAVDHDAAGILVDALHVQRSDSPFEVIETIPPDWINYAQLCDAPGKFESDVESLIATARGNRLMPGDGSFDFNALLKALPKDIVLSIEVPQLERAGLVPAVDRAREALDKAKLVAQRKI